ncbi:MAG: hypothetical protein NC548_27900 [Lachnospiraceae bacterium]|nr:hypothetical protein [Lachnospiraceae bacterium]
MKKMVISLLCTLAALLFNNTFVMAQQQNEDTRSTEIVLIKTQTPNVPIFRAPARVSISAVLDGSTGEIEIVFDEPEGNATIEISCMGQIVSKYVCNTAEEWVVFMPIPANSGTYSLNITTASAEYIGYFSL